MIVQSQHSTYHSGEVGDQPNTPHHKRKFVEHCTRTVRTFDHDVKRPHKVDGHEQKRQRSGDSHDEPQDLGGLATKRERVGLREVTLVEWTPY